MMNRFIAVINNSEALLTTEESWHCAKVLRMKAGEMIELIDGVGNSYMGILKLVSEKQCIADITEGPVEQKKRGYYLHVAISPTKNIDRIEWMVEKAVEIGLDELSFIRCKNSERTTVKTERIQKIIQSAVKQSKQAFIPEIHDLRKFEDLLELQADLKLIAYCGEAQKTELRNLSFNGKHVLILIGPEGDFSPEEVKIALTRGFQAVSLGNSRLRTETAGLAAVMTLAIKS
jgi:16S rRNA (uracil1498-N3)-methyltransferase